MNRQLLILPAVVALLALAGCPSLWNTKVEEKALTAEELFKEAEARFSEKSYDKAVELYDKLKSAYPEFEKIAEVHEKIADALYEKGDYDRAIERYHKFMEFFPAHKDVPRAKFHIAMGYFNQIRSTDLDNRIVSRAADSFKSLREDPDAGEWAKKASEKYDECLKKFAEKELYKAETYMGMGKYASAKMAAKRVLEEYGKLGYDEKAEALLKKMKGK